jgi:Putative beta barrel porin-7 (BBP7)
MMRQLLPSAGLLLVLVTTAAAQTPINQLFAPPAGDPFESSFFTAPNTRVLPNGSEVPPPAPEALLGPGDALCRERVWLSADFLYVSSSRTLLPPLVTTSPVGTDNSVAGILGRNSTSVAFGGNQLSGLRAALRAEAGVRLTECWGIDGTFLYTDSARSRFESRAVPGGTLLARPVVTAAGESAVLIGQYQPDDLSASASTRLIGGDVNLRRTLGRGKFGSWDLLAGYRYLSLRDAVRVANDNTTLPANIFPGGAFAALTRNSISDTFRSLNQFHGPQVGLATTQRLFDRLTLSARLGVALGVTLTDTTLTGTTTANGVTAAGGLLVAASNAGRHAHTAFAVLPSADVRLGYDVTDWLRLNVGYTFLYWNQVQRAADQIDRSTFPGRPAYPGDSSGYWLQGVTLGAEVRY